MVTDHGRSVYKSFLTVIQIYIEIIFDSYSYLFKLGCSGLYWAVPSCNKLYLAVLSCAGLNWAELSCSELYGAVLSSTGLYKA